MRIIIAGSGPSGLVLAHALLRAGFAPSDVVVLERRPEVVEPSGNCLALYPHTIRVMDQLGGLHREVLKRGTVMTYSTNLEAGSGKVFSRTPFFRLFEKSFGRPFVLLDRMSFLDLLWTSLPHRDVMVHTSKSITSISQDADSVTVTCDDGSTYSGDVLIGADGVRSIVRRLAVSPATLAAAEAAVAAAVAAEGLSAKSKKRAGKGVRQGALDPARIRADTATEGPFTTRYSAMFGFSPLPQGVRPGEGIEAHTSGVTVQMLTYDTGLVFWAVYRPRSPDLSTTREYARYGAEDMEEFAKAALELFAATGEGNSLMPSGDAGSNPPVTFRDLWETRIKERTGLLDLEEGVIQGPWHHGRVVLVGDAVHKMTPNIGFGCNQAIESVVLLVNQLHALRESLVTSDNGNPDAEILRLQVFEPYQTKRQQRARKWVRTTGRYTRGAAWETRVDWFFQRYVAPFLGDDFVMENLIGELPRDAPVLDWLEEEDYVEGAIPWTFGRRPLKSGNGALVKSSKEKGATQVKGLVPWLVSWPRGLLNMTLLRLRRMFH